jgi:octaprenyl-diphosphate synthase
MSVSNKLSQQENISPLDQLVVLQRQNLDAVNAMILSRMQSDVPMIPKLAGHLIAGGGKRVRPLLTLAAASLFGYDGPRTHKLAAAVEFIHTATLLHDDVVDESDQRRGKASANAVFGNEAAVLVGDFLFSRSFQLMVEDGSIDVLRVLSNASAVIAEGEVLQLSMLNDISLTEEIYFKIIGAKTAALFAAACETGAIAAGATAQQRQKMHDYGYFLGMAFQISDDVLDYGADEAKLGKSLGDDFREGKVTLPIIYALQKATPQQKDFLRKCLQDMQQDENDFSRALDIILSTGGLATSLEKAQGFAAQAALCLNGLPQAANSVLRDLAFFAADRNS